MPKRSSHDMHELVGAYALDALEADEVDAFELHLAECPRCRAELVDHRETAAMLAYAGAAAPDGLWDRIAAELEEAPPDIDKIFPLARAAAVTKPQRRFSTEQIRRATVLAAAVAAAIIGVNSALLLQQRDQLSDIDNSPVVNLRALADKALTAKGSRVATLRSADGATVGKVVLTSSGQGYVLDATMRRLDDSKTYQLWGVAGSLRPVSLGLLGTHPTVASFTAASNVDHVAITIERAEGALAPSMTPLASGALQTA